MSIPYGEDSLFKFYCALHDVCANMQLGPVELMHYYEPLVRIGKYVIDGRWVEGQLAKDGMPAGRTVRNLSGVRY